MLVVVGVQLVGSVLEGVILVLRVGGGDIAALHERAHGLYGVALAVVEGDKGLAVAQAVARGGGVEAGDSLLNGCGVLLGEGITLLHGAVVQSSYLDHVLNGNGLEVILPARVLAEALGHGAAEHGDVRRVKGLIVQVLRRVEHAEVAAVAVHKAGIGIGVVILEVSVRVFVVAYGDRSRAAVKQVGVQQYDDHGEDHDYRADDAPACTLLFSLLGGLALCKGTLVGALHALGLASLFVLRCAHWCFILYNLKIKYHHSPFRRIALAL